MATNANSTYTFLITQDGVNVRGAHPKSGLANVIIQGICTDKDGKDFNFVATNNLDLRYPERFKVNWNGSKARMPKKAGLGISKDLKGSLKVSRDLYFTRGARIAIARKCIALFPVEMQSLKGRELQAEADAAVAQLPAVIEEQEVTDAS